MSKKKEMDKNVEEEISEELTEELTEDNDQDTKDEIQTNEVDELTVKLTRLQADFVNYKKRSEIEKSRSMAFGIETFVCELLPIVDNFERAINSEEDKGSGLYKGVEMILNQLKSLMESKGIQEIEDIGTEFDPNIHNAISMEESDDFKPGIVISALQKGYKYKDKVIRPSMVIVSK